MTFLIKLLHLLPSETAHHLSLSLFQHFPLLAHLVKARKFNCSFDHPLFHNPVGLAAGFDKNAIALNFWDQIGFGAIEVGTVTLRPQMGNPKPRIWRMAPHSLQNAMGFPNQGAQVILSRIKNYRGKTPLGVNIGLNKDTPQAQAAEHYRQLYQMFSPYCQYMVVNISSPNTQGLRDLHQLCYLKEILQELQKTQLPTPLYFKISPDEDSNSLLPLLQTLKDHQVFGVIATNTTSQLSTIGGVSGQLLKPYSQKVWTQALAFCQEADFDLIACGGFSTHHDFYDYFEKGGQVLQVYTALTYHGFHVLSEAFKAYQLIEKKNLVAR